MGLSGKLCARSIYLAKLKLLSFQGLICVTPMEGPGGGLMRHKMMINEFIGRCSSNKGSRASIYIRSLAAALNPAGIQPPGSSAYKGFPTCPALDTFLCFRPGCFLWAVLDPRFRSENGIRRFWKRRAGSSCPPSPPAGKRLKPGTGLGLVQ